MAANRKKVYKKKRTSNSKKGSVTDQYLKALSKTKVRTPFSPSGMAYLRAVADPFNAAPTHIPDLTSYPSSPFAVEEEVISFSAHATKLDVGLRVFLGSQNFYHKFERTLVGDGTFLFNAGGNAPFASNSTISTEFRATRIVAAAFSVEYVGRSDSDAGLVTAAFIGSGELNAALANSIMPSATSLANHRGAHTFPVRHGAVCYYAPTDPFDFRYLSTSQNPSADTGGGTIDSVAGGSFGCLVLYCQGMVASQQVRFRVRVLKEGIEKSDTIKFNATKTRTKSDLKAVESVKGKEPHKQKMDTTEVGKEIEILWKDFTSKYTGFLGGLTIPGTRYCGPFNPIPNQEPQSQLDAICFKHDLNEDYTYLKWHPSDDVLLEDMSLVPEEERDWRYSLVKFYFDKKRSYLKQ